MKRKRMTFRQMQRAFGCERVECPVCGEMAFAKRYRDGSLLYVHEAERCEWGGVGCIDVRGCYVTAKAQT